MSDEEKKSKEGVSKQDMEKFPKIGKGPKEDYDNMEEFPKIGKEPENKKSEVIYKKKSHKLRNLIIGLGILAGIVLAGDVYLQGSSTEINMKKDDIAGTEIKMHTNYVPGKGYRLEERITKTKEFTKYDEHKALYGIGAGIAAGAAGMFFLMRKKRKY